MKTLNDCIDTLASVLNTDTVMDCSTIHLDDGEWEALNDAINGLRRIANYQLDTHLAELLNFAALQDGYAEYCDDSLETACEQSQKYLLAQGYKYGWDKYSVTSGDQS